MISVKGVTSHRVISKLVLQISHVCNLHCSYCCTNKGSFGSKGPKMMPKTIALDSLELFSKIFRKIENIYLFGGEPTLNLAIIGQICDKVNELVKNDHLGIKPNVGFTTNGTLMEDEFIRIVKNYGLNVGVSLDGPQTIHDRLRMDSCGRGTYTKIIENIRNTRKQTQQPSTIGLTYTSFHLNSGVQLWDILEALKVDTGIKMISVNPAFDTHYTVKEAQNSVDPFRYNPEKVINEMANVLTKSMRSMATSDDPIVLSTIPIFLKQFSTEKIKDKGIISCPAGSAYFTIAADGTIYPCQNLPETRRMKIGHIYEANIEAKLFKSNVAELLKKANDCALLSLNDSWLNRFVKVCPACNISETNSLTKPAHFREKMYLSMAREFAINLFKIMSNSQEKSLFMQNVQKI